MEKKTRALNWPSWWHCVTRSEGTDANFRTPIVSSFLPGAMEKAPDKSLVVIDDGAEEP